MTARLTRPEYRLHALIEGRDDQDLIDTLLAWDGEGPCPLTAPEVYRAMLVADDGELARFPSACGDLSEARAS